MKRRGRCYLLYMTYQEGREPAKSRCAFSDVTRILVPSLGSLIEASG